MLMSTVDVFAPFKPAIDVNKVIPQKGKNKTLNTYYVVYATFETKNLIHCFPQSREHD